jgi:hypothetical protein
MFIHPHTPHTSISHWLSFVHQLPLLSTATALALTGSFPVKLFTDVGLFNATLSKFSFSRSRSFLANLAALRANLRERRAAMCC